MFPLSLNAANKLLKDQDAALDNPVGFLLPISYLKIFI